MKMYETRPEAQRLTPKIPVILDTDIISATASARDSATVRKSHLQCQRRN